MCPPDYTDYNCTATIDIGISSPNRVEVKKYVGSAVPSGSLLIIILIVTMVIITLVCHHKRKRVPILPPPSLPMDDGIETDKVVEKGVPMETSTHSEPEHHVYEDPTTYEIPVKVNPDGEKVSVSIDATTGSTEN
jgi:hypothetical protein